MSHHGNGPFPDENNPVLKALFEKVREQQKDLQGEFPDGRLNPQDEGAMSVGITHENGKVVMQFARNLNWIGFTADQAIDIAQMLIKHARKCGSNKPLTLEIG